MRVATSAELDRYMRGSAGAVGLIMAPLLGAPPELHSTVAELGTAFQLTNFIRDVREDFELDRVYLPAEERARHGVTVQDIAERRTTDGLRTLLAARGERGLGACSRAPRSSTRRSIPRRAPGFAWRARCTSASLTASRRSASTSSAIPSACLRGSWAARRLPRCRPRPGAIARIGPRVPMTGRPSAVEPVSVR